MLLLNKKNTLSLGKLKQSNAVRGLVCVVALSLSACSPGVFFGSGVDQKVIGMKSSRRINKSCGDLDVSQSQFTVTSFRRLIQCFNSNKSIEPLSQLVSAVADSDLSPMVDAVNRSLVSSDARKQKRFFELEQTYQSWVKHGIQKEIFKQSSKILERSDFWMSVVSVLRSGFYDSGSHQVNLQVLKAVELLSAELDAKAFENTLKVGLTYAEAPAFVSLQGHLADQPLSDAQIQLISQSLMDFMNQPQALGEANQRQKMKSELTWAIQNDRLFPLLDQLVGVNQEQILAKAPELAKVLNGLVSEQSSGGEHSFLIDALSSAFRELSRPVSCMKDSKEIKDATRYLIRELAEFRSTAEARDYITREAPLTFMALGPFCQLPPQMTQHYPAMFRLAESGVLEPMVNLLKVLYQEVRADEVSTSADGTTVAPPAGEPKRPWIDFMLAMFLDPGAPHLTPILKTLSQKNASLDLIFLSNLVTDSDRNSLNRFLKFMVKPQAELGQKSVVDVFSQALSQTQTQDVVKLILSGRKFLDLPDGFLRSSLKTIHQAHFVNNVHPFIDLVKEVGGSASTLNRPLFEAIFRISEKHPEQLKKSMEFIAQLAEGDELSDLTEALFKVSRKMIDQGRAAKTNAIQQGLEVAVQELTIPNAVVSARHSLASIDRENTSFRSRIEALFRQWGFRLGDSWPVPIPSITPSPASDACRNLDFSFSLDHVGHAEFETHLQAFLTCQGSSAAPTSQDLVTLIGSLNRTRMGELDTDPTFFAFQVDTLKTVFQSLGTEDVRVLVNNWMRSYDHPDRRFFRLLDAIPYWVSKPIPRNLEHPEEQPQSIAQSVLKTTQAIVADAPVRAAFHELLQAGSNIVRRDDFPQILRDLDEVFLAPREEVPAVVPGVSPEDEIFNEEFKARIRAWLIAKEGWRAGESCQWDQTLLERRVQEIIDEAKTNVTNRELVEVPQAVERKPKSSWTVGGLRAEINPLLDRMRDQRMSDQEGHGLLIDAFSKFLRRYTRPSDIAPHLVVNREGTPAWRTPEYLLNWLHQRSRDYRLIQYYYPGEANPRVRAVSTLDLLDLTLINVDMEMPAPPYKNLAFEFLAELAEAWGDEPRAQWPVEIQQRYPMGSRPPTLYEAVGHITERKGVTERLEDLETLSTYVIGLPEAPRCSRHLDGDPFLPVPNETAISLASWTFPLLNIQEHDAFEFKRKLFNLWQVKGVLWENVPGSHRGYNGGLEVLRDLFFEIYYTTPANVRRATFPAAWIAQNNLNAVTAAVRLGAMRQMGRLMQRFPVGDPLLKDIVMNVIQTGASSQLGPIMRTLVERQIEDHTAGGRAPYQLVWKLVSLIDQASPIERERLKNTAIHLIGSMSQIDPWSPILGNQDTLVDLLLTQGQGVLSDQYAFLTSIDGPSSELLKSLLFSSVAATESEKIYKRVKDVMTVEQKVRFVNLARGVLNERSPTGRSRTSAGVELLKAVVNHPESWEASKTLMDQLGVLKDHPDYQRLNVYTAIKPGLEFFEENSETAARLRMQLARLLYDPELAGSQKSTQILMYAQRNPNEFNQLLNLLGHSVERGDLQEFLKVMRRSLPNAD